MCAGMRNASAYQPEPECVAIANGLAGLDGPVINCVTLDYITDAADPLYYIRACSGRIVRYVRAARRDGAIRVCLPDARGNALVRACNKSAATGRDGRNARGETSGCERPVSANPQLQGTPRTQMTHAKKRLAIAGLGLPTCVNITGFSYLLATLAGPC